MQEEIREKIEDLVNHFLEGIDGNLPEKTLVNILGDIEAELNKLNPEDEDVIREYALIGVYYTGLDEKKGLEMLKKAFALKDKMGLIEIPAPFADDEGNQYNTIVYATMANFLSDNKEKAEAIKYFEQAYKKYEVEKDGMSAACYALDYAGCLIDQNRTDEAVKILNLGIQASYEAFGEYNPIALSLIKGLSMLYKKLGDKENEEKYENMFAAMYDHLEEQEDECGCGCDCGHEHHHHEGDCDCGCDCGHEHHHHHDDDCDCGCHH